jgi:thiol-disulfide isomerase/thioredoxin
MNFKNVILPIVFSILSTFSFSQEKSNYSKFPNIKLFNLDQDSTDLSEKIKTKELTVISFWATWCAPCKKELNAIHKVYESWQEELDIQLIAISIDNDRTVGRVESYVESSQWNYSVLLDTDWRLKKALDIQNIPFTLIVDENYNILYSHQNYADGDEQLLYEELVQASMKK